MTEFKVGCMLSSGKEVVKIIRNNDVIYHSIDNIAIKYRNGDNEKRPVYLYLNDLDLILSLNVEEANEFLKLVGMKHYSKDGGIISRIEIKSDKEGRINDPDINNENNENNENNDNQNKNVISW